MNINLIQKHIYTFHRKCDAISKTILIHNFQEYTYNLLNQLSSFSSKAFGILLALDKLKYKTVSKYIVTSDSNSIIQEIRNLYTNKDLELQFKIK